MRTVLVGPDCVFLFLFTGFLLLVILVILLAGLLGFWSGLLIVGAFRFSEEALHVIAKVAKASPKRVRGEFSALGPSADCLTVNLERCTGLGAGDESV